LKELGFGYRAKYIVGSARMVKEKGGENWLMGLRQLSKEEAKNELITLPGVGPKVADCIALFSLDHLGVVPVDTHVWKMANKFMASATIKGASPTPKLHSEINAFFIEKFGDKAGWAHTILFSAAITKEGEAAANADSSLPSTKKRSTDASDEAPDAKRPKSDEL
jgi:N-glycosylase/DNA lyase